MPARTSDEKIKFLAAVSSLANTAGGDLMVGIEAVDGLAHAIPGIEILNVDAEKLRLEQLLRIARSSTAASCSPCSAVWLNSNAN
jgi:predicted HTH transcriptional regulator